jgi:hypothetical protein
LIHIQGRLERLQRQGIVLKIEVSRQYETQFQGEKKIVD